MRSIIKVLFGLTGLLCSFSAHAISGSSAISIVSFSTGTILPADVNGWAGLTDGPSLTAQSSAAAPGIRSVLIIRITQGGVPVYGNSATGGFPVGPFTIRSFSSADFSLALRGGPVLSAGSYSLCIQFLSGNGVPISEEACRNFAVENPPPPPNPTYNPPRNLSPVNNKIFSQDEMRLPIAFSWTPVTPAPEGPITYRLRIWQMFENQTVDEALQAEPTIVKDVTDGTQVSVSDFLTPPCKAPLLCKFAWTVQALNPAGLPVGAEKGSSQPSMASAPAAQYIIRIDSMKIACTATAGVYSFSYYITNANPGIAKLTNLVVTSSLPPGATITSFSPPLNSSIVSGSQLIITGLITGSASLTSICVGAEITDVANTFNKASKDTCIKVPPCRCSVCDDDKLSIVTPAATVVVNANNTMSMNQPLIITTTPAKLIKSIAAELVYFEYLPESEDCLPCNKDSKTYGNIGAGVLAGMTGLDAGTHSMFWNFSPPISFTSGQTASMAITLPVSVACCAATIRWCIRYLITFDDCTVCSKLVCYENKKNGCGPIGINPNNN